MGKQLNKYDTAILMCTKNNKIKLKYEYDQNFVFKNHNKLLNQYKDLAMVYADSKGITLESVCIEYIIKSMLEIFEVVYQTKFKEFILELMKPSIFDKEKTLNEKIFEELYGYLQALTMLNNGKELFDLDYSLVEEEE